MSKLPIIFSTLLFCLASFGADTKFSEVPTVQNLVALAKYSKINPLPKVSAAMTVEEQVASLCVSIKEASANNKKAALYAEALSEGVELLKSAAVLEAAAQKKGYRIWWRFTRGIEEDISKQGDISFGLTLLAGIVKEGIKYFKHSNASFDSACIYIDCANSRYVDRLVAATSGALVMLPLTIDEENQLLDGELCNLGVLRSPIQTVLGEGESFHPRLPVERLKYFKDYLVTVWPKDGLVSTPDLLKQLEDQMR